MNLIIPKDYKPALDIRQTQEAIKYIRDTFQDELGRELKLQRISAPLFVTRSSGLNDDLNGSEEPVHFTMTSQDGEEVQVVHSLAKWKRAALGRYGFGLPEGLYTNMNAIRKDEELDNLHSAYVDQWDWEKVIGRGERNVATLKEHVETIFKVIKHMEHEVWYKYPQAVHHLPDMIHFVTSEQLLDLYPDLTPKERENAITKELGCVFVMKIGAVMRDGQKHDGRAPDYDDWDLNGDLLVWDSVGQRSFELSSMGIRVDPPALERQLRLAGCEERRELPFHRMLLNGELPLTMGGGIGQSRVSMLMLGKAHIGEVQSSLWDGENVKAAEEAGFTLL